MKTNLHKVNAGLNGSVGFSIDINKIRIYTEGGGNYGLISINKQDEDGKNLLNVLVEELAFLIT